MRPSPRALAAALLGGSALVAPHALAQESAARRAADAFGERVGIEQVGLYGEGNVRGFDLQNSGAYRIDGHYFARHNLVGDTVLDGVGVRVGVNATRLEQPSPSGVVNYRLRDTTGDSRARITTGFRDYGTFVADVGGVWVSKDDRFGVSANVISRPDITWAMGTEGEIHEAGAVGRWSPSDTVRVRAVAAATKRFWGGDYGVVASESVLPPPVKPVQAYSPPWARGDQTEHLLGLLAEGGDGGWTWGASAFQAGMSPERSDQTLLRVDRNGAAQATIFRAPDRRFVSDSYEARLARVVDGEVLEHRLAVSARLRRTRAETAPGVAISLGTVNIALEPTWPAETEVADDGRRVQDEVDQSTVSFGYGVTVRDGPEVRLGLHRTTYEKRVTPIGGTESAREETRWFYNASAVWPVSDRTAVFASWVTGLEETGTAPQKATNRNEILPPVEAEQKEFGVRHALTSTLSLIGAVFEVSKPTMGFRPDGTFGPVGQVTHRGVEASLSGRAGDTNVVLGVAAVDPEVSGPLVDAGAVGPEPAGLSKLRAQLSLERDLAFAPGWSADLLLTWDGERQADTRNSFVAPGHALLNLGVRKRFAVGETTGLLRVLVSNVTGEEGWWASSSEMLWPVAPRTARATVTLNF